jgi:hypothetical protein
MKHCSLHLLLPLHVLQVHVVHRLSSLLLHVPKHLGLHLLLLLLCVGHDLAQVLPASDWA